MTKAEKLLQEQQAIEAEQHERMTLLRNKRAELEAKLKFSGSMNKDEPVIRIQGFNPYGIIGANTEIKAALCLAPNSKESVLVEGIENIRRLRDWLTDILGDAVIQEMKEIKDENTR